MKILQKFPTTETFLQLKVSEYFISTSSSAKLWRATTCAQIQKNLLTLAIGRGAEI